MRGVVTTARVPTGWGHSLTGWLLFATAGLDGCMRPSAAALAGRPTPWLLVLRVENTLAGGTVDVAARRGLCWPVGPPSLSGSRLAGRRLTLPTPAFGVEVTEVAVCSACCRCHVPLQRLATAEVLLAQANGHVAAEPPPAAPPPFLLASYSRFI